MNLQEHVGKYLIMRQLGQRERFHYYLAIQKREEGMSSSPTERFVMYEVATLPRGWETPQGEYQINALSEKEHSLIGWIEVTDVQPDSALHLLFKRSWLDGIKLTTLIDSMNRTGRRLPLLQGMRLLNAILQSSLLCARRLTTRVQLEEELMCCFDGTLRLNLPQLDETLFLGRSSSIDRPLNQDERAEWIRWILAIACDLSLWNEELSSSPLEVIEAQFQGPVKIKTALEEILQKLLSSESVTTKELDALTEHLSMKVQASHLTCSDEMLGTFFNSTLPYESAQAKRDRQQLSARAAQELLPKDEHALFSIEDDFLDGDDRTQSTLTIVPKGTSVQQYDALSTDSSDDESDTHSIDVDAEAFQINHDLELALSDSQHRSPSDTEDVPPPMVVSDEEADQAVDDPVSPVRLNLKESGLLPPRAGDIQSKQAKARRSIGDGFHTQELLGPDDDFDSIDLSGVQAETLRSAEVGIKSSLVEPLVSKQQAPPPNMTIGNLAQLQDTPPPSEMMVEVPPSSGPLMYAETPSPIHTGSREMAKTQARLEPSQRSGLKSKLKPWAVYLLTGIIATGAALFSKGLQLKIYDASDTQNEKPSIAQEPEAQERPRPQASQASKESEAKKEQVAELREKWRGLISRVQPQPTSFWVRGEPLRYKKIDDLSVSALEHPENIFLFAPGHLSSSLDQVESELNREQPDEMTQSGATPSLFILVKGEYPTANFTSTVAPKSASYEVTLNHVPLAPALLKKAKSKREFKLELPIGFPSLLSVERKHRIPLNVVRFPTPFEGGTSKTSFTVYSGRRSKLFVEYLKRATFTLNQGDELLKSEVNQMKLHHEFEMSEEPFELTLKRSEESDQLMIPALYAHISLYFDEIRSGASKVQIRNHKGYELRIKSLDESASEEMIGSEAETSSRFALISINAKKKPLGRFIVPLFAEHTTAITLKSNRRNHYGWEVKSIKFEKTKSSKGKTSTSQVKRASSQLSAQKDAKFLSEISDEGSSKAQPKQEAQPKQAGAIPAEKPREEAEAPKKTPALGNQSQSVEAPSKSVNPEQGDQKQDSKDQ